ncbi:ABC transporter permease [Methanoregula sp.]|uniref:ABC transporter permease n=1 Tax=Methanoregula sp. TaxID=2052170 RepID=UPI0026153058|nr:ABC transporter permease [Methanoregula sp.]MDD5142713.1 ABC transporter permease [Methanoregula sp.]
MKTPGSLSEKHRRLLAYLGAAILILSVTLYLALPVAALFFRTTPELFLASLSNPQVISALWLSLTTSVISLTVVILVGTPFAFVHSRSNYPGKVIVDTLIDLPLVLPPAVAGFALLVLYGRMGLLGKYFHMMGISIAFTTLAVIIAQIFVASPFYIRQAKSLFEQFDQNYEYTARTLGASPVRTFLTITLPLTAGGLLSGAVMTFGRALGEFGATIMFAGNLPGVTQTMPLAVYVGMESNFDMGLTISILLVIISFIIMISVRLITRRGMPHA